MSLTFQTPIGYIVLVLNINKAYYHIELINLTENSFFDIK